MTNNLFKYEVKAKSGTKIIKEEVLYATDSVQMAEWYCSALQKNDTTHIFYDIRIVKNGTENASVTFQDRFIEQLLNVGQCIEIHVKDYGELVYTWKIGENQGQHYAFNHNGELIDMY